ncbi:hypothetical protein [Shewanella youngdeokensis]|uniref:Uncharacterized protein n=1 Tax=Shewanella youngdeokensis TaxID=2999068 RepID=A0ABZ0K299_9GAMM|nr:hypothetical protein RGE70_03325 [Shewanella sp. DAU334]
MFNNKKPQLVAVLALLMLIVAVQVSTDRACDWLFIGLGLIELAHDTTMSLPSISNVALSVGDNINQIALCIFNGKAESLFQ